MVFVFFQSGVVLPNVQLVAIREGDQVATMRDDRIAAADCVLCRRTQDGKNACVRIKRWPRRKAEDARFVRFVFKLLRLIKRIEKVPTV